MLELKLLDVGNQQEYKLTLLVPGNASSFVWKV